MGNREAEKQSADARNVAPGLAELRKMVEAATGRDRAVDDAVWWSISCLPRPTIFREVNGCRQYNVMFGMGDGADWRPLGPYNEAPAYTASLDAVLALVGEKLPGWVVRADIYPSHASFAVEPPFDVNEVCGPVRVYAQQGEAKTPALALLSALLAALSEAGPERRDARFRQRRPGPPHLHHHSFCGGKP